MIDEIRERIQAVVENPASLSKSGLLFHGTAEPFDAKPDAVGVDGVLWFSRSPLVSQAYIPSSGISAIVARPYEHRLNERIWPEPGFWTDFAVNEMGYVLPDVEVKNNRVISYSSKMPWPTLEQCLTKLAEFGYTFERSQTEDVKQSVQDHKFRVMPKDWRLQGRVFVTLDEGLRFADLSTGESDLTQYAHLQFDRFRKAEQEGYAGVIIDDFAQSDDMGNVGHRSFGLFADALKDREFLVYDAVHRPMASRTHLTEDFMAFAATLHAAPVP